MADQLMRCLYSLYHWQYNKGMCLHTLQPACEQEEVQQCL